MKTSNILLIILFLSFISCEKVIDVDLATGKTRLVVEASINWYANTSGNEQKIKLSTSLYVFDHDSHHPMFSYYISIKYPKF